jgi:hypothetical protein
MRPQSAVAPDAEAKKERGDDANAKVERIRDERKHARPDMREHILREGTPETRAASTYGWERWTSVALRISLVSTGEYRMTSSATATK